MDYVQKSIMDYEESHLEEKYFDYRMLYREYAEGIMLFELMDEKVWSKAVKDSVGLANYYKENKEKYMSGEMIEATIYNAATDSIISSIRAMVENEDTLLRSKKAVKSYFNEKSELNLKIDEGLFDESDPIIQKLREKKPGIYTINHNNRFYLIVVDNINSPEPELLEDIRGVVISDYQEFLEKEWLKTLRKNYTVDFNKDKLETLIYDLENK